MLYESDDESNKIDLLYEGKTTERNGVKIIVPVKYGDRSEFYNKIKEQLAYFENVYFDCGDGVKNDFSIVRSEHFQWSPLTTNNNLHICLDNVYYPLEFSKLGINTIHIPIGLRFSLSDGIFPTPNREQIKYTIDAKAVIMAKIAQVAEYFVKKYNESIKDSGDIHTVMAFYSDNSRKIDNYIGGKWTIDQLGKYSTNIKFINPELKGLKWMTSAEIYRIKDYLLQEYEMKYYLYNGRFSSEEKKRYKTRIGYELLIQQNIYVYKELSFLKKSYFRDTLVSNTRFVKKCKLIPLGTTKVTGGGYDNYIQILHLKSFPKSEWRDRIKECQYVMSLLASRFVDADKIEISQEWVDGRKKALKAIRLTGSRRKKLTGEITAKVACSLERYVSGRNCKFTPEVFQMEEAHKSPKFTIYGGVENNDLFDQLYTTFNKGKVRLILLSERELKNLSKISLHNWMEIGKFMDGKHKVFRRAVTGYLINKLNREYNSVFTNTEQLSMISTPLAQKIDLLNDYLRDNHYTGHEDVYKSMVEVAEEHKLFDTSIYDVYKEVKAILERLPFINPMFSNFNRYGMKEGAYLDCIKDLFKYYRQRMNWENYRLPINEEIDKGEAEEILASTEEELTN